MYKQHVKERLEDRSVSACRASPSSLSPLLRASLMRYLSAWRMPVCKKNVSIIIITDQPGEKDVGGRDARGSVVSKVRAVNEG